MSLPYYLVCMAGWPKPAVEIAAKRLKIEEVCVKRDIDDDNRL